MHRRKKRPALGKGKVRHATHVHMRDGKREKQRSFVARMCVRSGQGRMISQADRPSLLYSKRRRSEPRKWAGNYRNFSESTFRKYMCSLGVWRMLYCKDAEGIPMLILRSKIDRRSKY